MLIHAAGHNHVVTAQPFYGPLDGGQLLVVGADRLQQHSGYLPGLVNQQRTAPGVITALAGLCHANLLQLSLQGLKGHTQLGRARLVNGGTLAVRGVLGALGDLGQLLDLYRVHGLSLGSRHPNRGAAFGVFGEVEFAAYGREGDL
ncbi:hypothetical protein D3C87_1367910 [compost metagenome]